MLQRIRLRQLDLLHGSCSSRRRPGGDPELTEPESRPPASVPTTRPEHQGIDGSTGQASADEPTRDRLANQRDRTDPYAASEGDTPSGCSLRLTEESRRHASGVQRGRTDQGAGSGSRPREYLMLISKPRRRSRRPRCQARGYRSVRADSNRSSVAIQKKVHVSRRIFKTFPIE